MYQFKLPDLGEGVHEGEVLHWYVKQGDQVGEDDPLVEVETDKAAVTIPSPKAGKVVSLNGEVGDTVTVGAVLVVIDESGTDASVEAAPSVATAVEVEPAAPSRAPGVPVPAAPATRRLARELGIDLHGVAGTGPGGRVTADDVKRHADGGGAAAATGGTARPSPAVPAATAASPAEPAAAPTASAPTPVVTQTAPPATVPTTTGAGVPFFEVESLPDFAQWGPVETEALRSIRRKVAHKMVASMTIVPHVAHMDEADVTDLEAFRREQNAKRDDGVKLTLLAFVIRAVVTLLRKTPQINASLDPHRQEIIYKKYYNIGFAADTPKGLMVPVIGNADRCSIVDIAQAIQDKASRARAGSLDVSELRGGTFTVTNVGTLGGTAVIPTINYPEVAILGLGRAAERPVVRDGKIVVRTILPMTLAFDHRLIDGADAARFVTALLNSLADPHRLLLEC